MTSSPVIAQLLKLGREIVGTSRVLSYVPNGVAVMTGLVIELERSEAARVDAEKSVGLLREAVERLTENRMQVSDKPLASTDMPMA